MSIKEIKKEMLKFKDLYGGELLDIDKVKQTKTKKELYEIIESHRNHMEMMQNDSDRHLDRFQQKLGLNHYI